MNVRTALFLPVLALLLVIAPHAAHAAVVVYDGGQPYAYVSPDASTNGGIINPSESGISSQTASMNRACYLVDPTAYPSYWISGQYSSPGDNSVIIWNGSIWQRFGAGGNWHIKELDCSTTAKADASLTASQATITQGDSVTLTWYSQYGSVRVATATSTNFSLGVFIPAHWGTVIDYYDCGGGGGGSQGNQHNNLAVGGCTPVYTDVWYPDSYGTQQFGGSLSVSPTQTTTYTYTVTNGNGSNSSSVTVQVAGTTQCTDLTDNDTDGLVDASDPGCNVQPGGCSGSCTNPENSELPDLTAGDVTPTAVAPGVSTTLSATITNGGGNTTTTGFNDIFQIDLDSDHTAVTVTLATTSPVLAVNGSRTAQVNYTFPSAGTWYVRACADNNASWVGTISEKDETNNCSSGGWTSVTVVSPPTGSLTAYPTLVTYNNASSLTWLCTNSTSASINNGIGAVTPASGDSVSTGALTADKSYTLTCTGTGGTTNYYASVTVTAPTLTLTASPNPVRPGGSTTVTWSTASDAQSCTTSGSGLTTSHTTSGSQNVSPINNSVTFTFVCSGATQKSVTVGIVPSYKEQ